MNKGLRKRETYDELIQEIDKEQINKYPDRRASQMENSNYLSQLSGGFDDMKVFHERMMKEKQKEFLLDEMVSENGGTRHLHSLAKYKSSVGSEGDFDSEGFSSLASDAFLTEGMHTPPHYVILSKPLINDLDHAEEQAEQREGLRSSSRLGLLDGLYDKPELTQSSSALAQHFSSAQPYIHRARPLPLYYNIAGNEEEEALAIQYEMYEEQYNLLLLEDERRNDSLLTLSRDIAGPPPLESLDRTIVRPEVLKIEDKIVKQKKKKDDGGGMGSIMDEGPEAEHEPKGPPGRPRSRPPKSSAAASSAAVRVRSESLSSSRAQPVNTSASASSKMAKAVENLEDITIKIIKNFTKEDWKNYPLADLKKQLKLWNKLPASEVSSMKKPDLIKELVKYAK